MRWGRRAKSGNPSQTFFVDVELRKRGISFTRNGGNVKIDGVSYTIHHYHKKGHFQLVATDAHRSINHIGIALWHS